MPRITTVAKARPSSKGRKCGRCGTPIEAGDKYYHWSNRAPGSRGGYKSYRCADHYPRASEVTASPYRSAAYAIQEDIEDFLSGDGWELPDLQSEVEAAADRIRDEVAEALRESAQNIEDGFGHETYQSSELNDRADAFESWADEVADAASEIESLLSELDEPCEHNEDEEGATQACEECFSDKRDEAQSTVENAIAQCPE